LNLEYVFLCNIMCTEQFNFFVGDNVLMSYAPCCLSVCYRLCCIQNKFLLGRQVRLLFGKGTYRDCLYRWVVS